MTQDGKKGYVITRTLDHKRNGFITCDYVEEQDAEFRYNMIASQLVFPQELTCRAAWLKVAGGNVRYWMPRDDSNDEKWHAD